MAHQGRNNKSSILIFQQMGANYYLKQIIDVPQYEGWSGIKMHGDYLITAGYKTISAIKKPYIYDLKSIFDSTTIVHSKTIILSTRNTGLPSPYTNNTPTLIKGRVYRVKLEVPGELRSPVFNISSNSTTDLYIEYIGGNEFLFVIGANYSKSSFGIRYHTTWNKGSAGGTRDAWGNTYSAYANGWNYVTYFHATYSVAGGSIPNFSQLTDDSLTLPTKSKNLLYPNIYHSKTVNEDILTTAFVYNKTVFVMTKDISKNTDFLVDKHEINSRTIWRSADRSNNLIAINKNYLGYYNYSNKTFNFYRREYGTTNWVLKKTFAEKNYTFHSGYQGIAINENLIVLGLIKQNNKYYYHIYKFTDENGVITGLENPYKIIYSSKASRKFNFNSSHLLFTNPSGKEIYSVYMIQKFMYLKH